MFSLLRAGCCEQASGLSMSSSMERPREPVRWRVRASSPGYGSRVLIVAASREHDEYKQRRHFEAVLGLDGHRSNARCGTSSPTVSTGQRRLQIVEQATHEWQHGNTVVTPMRVAMDYVARLDQTRCETTAELEHATKPM
jgi:hypothetical protein